MIGDRISSLSYYFPWSLVIALVVAIIFAAIGIIIFKRAISKADEEPAETKESPIIEKIRNYIGRLGYYGTDALSQSFTYALNLMYEFIGGAEFRYKLPWIVMMGTSQSGKSTALGSVHLDRPIGRPIFETESGDLSPCDWWYYDHGVVLDVSGKLVLDANQPISNEEDWKQFVTLLQHHRPKRALDGIVLTIPASEFVGPTALSHDDIMIRAEYLYGKLWQLQYLTGIRVPIYLVVTKCDLIQGFTSFCQSIPSHNRHDMFGWSNDHAVDAVYESEWIDEAFNSINNGLYQNQEEIYTSGETTEGRDGVFLFPITLNRVRGGLRTYADHIFKSSGYHESFFLRGIYFVGEGEVAQSAPSPVKAMKISSKPALDLKSLKRNLFFADNLLEYKIFREVGLARPVSKILLGNTTIMRYAKVGVAVAIILGTLGLLRANDSLQTAKIKLTPALNQIETTLKKISGEERESNIGRVFFENQAEVLLNTMSQLGSNHLTSIFIPPSWFSNLDSKIQYVMGVAYDKVILRSMGSELAYKAGQLFSLDSIIPVNEPTETGISPLQTTEFYRLHRFVSETKNLEKAAYRYNQLGKTSTMEDVAAIIKYLFNYEMPESFYDTSSYYFNALQRANLKDFDFSIYRDDATSKLRKLFDEFQIAAFDPKLIIPGLGSLVSDLNEFTGSRSYASYDADLLRNIYKSLNITINSLQNPGLGWMSADHFTPGPAYEQVIGLIVGSTFFSEAATSDLINEVDDNYTKFRQKLARLKSPLISGGHIFVIEDDKADPAPSKGALALQQNLTLFFDEAFMEPSEATTFITNIPAGSVLMWDTLRLQEATDLITSYSNFMNTDLLNMPKVLQPMLQKIGRENLTSNIVRLVSNAEIFSTDHLSTYNDSPEDAILAQVQNYRASSPYLEQILFALKANNANSAFTVLKDMLSKQAYAPLKALDGILNNEDPYAIKSNSFDWWEGENLAALEAFGVNNLTQLKNYLELERDRLHYLAKEFAAPLVSFLSDVNKEGMPGNLPLVTKWEGIIKDLQGYQKKSPGNALIELEDYITTTLNDVTLSTCNKYASSLSPLSENQDYFTTILVGIEEKLLKRCTDLSGLVSTNQYNQVAEFFNSNLAGTFPFVEDNMTDVPDARPEDIKALFQLIDSQKGNLKETLKQATHLGAAGENAYAFVDQIEKIREFFGGFLTPDSTLPYASFTYDVKFRVNQDREERANEIISWELTSEDTTVTMRTPNHLGYWKQGDPISMNFRWALNSPLQPQDGESGLAYSVSGEDATFSYGGTWGLLRLLKCHKASPGDFASLNDKQPNTLRFDIPLTGTTTNKSKSFASETPKAQVFVRLEVSPVKEQKPKKASDSKSKDSKSDDKSASSSSKKPKLKMGKPVALPYFPSKAPQISHTSGGN